MWFPSVSHPESVVSVTCDFDMHGITSYESDYERIDVTISYS